MSLVEPILQAATLRNGRSNTKVITFAFLFGLALAVSLCSMFGTRSSGPAISMASLSVQPSKVAHFLEPAMLSHHKSAVRAQPWLHHLIYPVRARQSILPAKAVPAVHVARQSTESEEKIGVMMRWVADRGFGFIQPEGGGDDVFCHVGSLVDGEDSVSEGNKVTYYEYYDENKGKTAAVEVRLAPGGEGDFRPAGSARGGMGPREEKRPAPDGSGSYTKEEFVEFYGGTAEWDAAAPKPPESGTGVVMRWMADRGFGFIRPEGGSDDLFCHVRSLVDGEGSVQEGNKVTFVAQFNDRQGKYEAGEVRLAEGGDGDFRDEMNGPPPGETAPEGGTGVLMRWMGDRGFGFVKPEGGGDEMFCHISALLDGEGSVQEGNKVTYVPAWDARKGSWRCSDVRLAPGGEGDFRDEMNGPPADQPAPEAGTGVLMRWMGDRGFGFIQPESGGDELFCHVGALADGEGSVQEGNKVTFVPSWDARKGNWVAGEVRLAPGGEGDFREAEGGAEETADASASEAA